MATFSAPTFNKTVAPSASTIDTSLQNKNGTKKAT